MDRCRCPQCNEMSLIYDYYMKVTKCLRLDCNYIKSEDYNSYYLTYRLNIKDTTQLQLFKDKKSSEGVPI